MMVERRDIEFEVEGGDCLRGWLFTPEAGTLSCPAISMAHGYAGVMLERFALAFAEAGFVRKGLRSPMLPRALRRAEAISVCTQFNEALNGA
jgi:hypothetical protein